MMKRDPWLKILLIFVSGYVVGGVLTAWSIRSDALPADPRERSIHISHPVDPLMHIAWPFHRDRCVKRREKDGFVSYIYRGMWFGTKESCENKRHPVPPSSHHWTPGSAYNMPPGVEVEDGTRYLDLFKYQPQKPAITVCDATNLSACIATICTKAGETGCVDVVCMGRNLVEGCTNYEPPPLEENRTLSALTIAVGAQLCKDRPSASVWIRDKTKWMVVPCRDLQFAITAVGGIGALI